MSRVRPDTGLTLTEMVVVMALLVVAIGTVFSVVQVLTNSANLTTADSTGSNDLSYPMELLSKTLMGSRLLYANDNRIVVVAQMSDGSYQVQSVYTSGAPGPTVTVGQLIWERWSSNASGTVPVGTMHSVWVMSAVNANAFTTPPTALFAYFKDATATSQLANAAPDKSSTPDTSMSAFLGTLPGGYNVSAIGRIRLHVAARFGSGIRDDYRDIVLRVRS